MDRCTFLSPNPKKHSREDTTLAGKDREVSNLRTYTKTTPV